MARYRKKLNSKFFIALALLVAAALVLSAAVGLALGNSKKGGEAVNPNQGNTSTNTDPETNTSENDPSGTGSDPAPGPEVPGNTASNTAPQTPGNTANNTKPGNTAQNTPGGTTNTTPGGSTTNPGGEDSDALSLKQLAAQMQDYTIDPSTGMAKDIKIVDTNYLLLVNRTHALAKEYVPDDMVTVKSVVSGVGVKGETDQLRKVAADAFEAMVEAAAKEGVKLKMRTGYRSYVYQRDRLYNVYVKNNGQKYADTISAKPGQSEHQTGLALDVGGASQNYALSRDFGKTAEGKWVAAHCHEYGFIIRYTDGGKDSPGKVTGFISEPWHIRYVGVAPATEIHNQGILLEEYLGILN